MRKKNHPLSLFVCFLLMSMIATPQLVSAQKETVAIIFDKKNETHVFTANEMKSNLERAGHKVVLAGIETAQQTKAQLRFILTVRDNAVASGLNDQVISSLPASKPQGYSIRKKTSAGSSDWYIVGTDKRGLIYGGLDASETVSLKGYGSLAEIDKTPYIDNRGIKFNIPLDARTPSYSDNGDAAQQNIGNMWDINFWHEFLDEMARDRFNMLSLWSLSPFPSLVDVPEYRKAGLNDVMQTTVRILPTTDATFMSTEASLANLKIIKKISLADKIRFWQQVMQYASDRGIDCYLFTWNLFVFGTEGSGYGITDGISNPKTKDYVRKATRTLLKTYPLLKGIGLTAGENMMRQTAVDKEKFLYESYGEGINDALKEEPERTFKLIHRHHQADIDMIKRTFSGLNPRCRLDFSYKYSVAQMYSSVAPKYIYESRFLEDIGDSKFFLTVRDDAWYNLRGGSDPAFARAYFKNIPKKNFEGFYVGPDGYTWGREYISKSAASPRQLVIKKRWYSFQILGKLAYDPEIADSHFAQLLQNRFPGTDAEKLQEAWSAGSQVMPLVNRFHNARSQNDYQWYPEACTSFYGFKTVNSFIKFAPQKGEGLIGIPEYSNAVLKSESIKGVTPLAIADQLQQTSARALATVATIKNANAGELKQTIDDIKAMAFLGQYYSKKITGAVYTDLYGRTSSAEQKKIYKDSALKNLKEAALNWASYANQINLSYLPQHLTRMHFTVDFKAMQAHVEKEADMLNQTPRDISTGAGKPLTEDIEVVFSDNSHYYYWHLDKLGLPENWSDFKYVQLEVFATSTQAFDFFLKAGGDTVIKRNVQPAKKGWNKIVVPFSELIRLQGKKQTAATGKTGSLAIPMNDITDLGISMDKPVGYPVLEIATIKLFKEQP